MSVTKEQLEKFKRHPCRRCGSVATQELYRTITADGNSLYFWQCLDCDDRASVLNIPHDVIRLWYSKGKIKTDLDEVPVLNDYRGNTCIVCGETSVQFHHFAPQAFVELFGQDWINWPGAYLCKPHHDLWHSILTWYMPGPAAPHPEMIKRYGAKSNVPIR